MDNNVHLHPSPGRSSSRSMSQRLYGALRSVMKSRRVRLPNYDLPIRFRPVRLSASASEYPFICSTVVPCLHGYLYDVFCTPSVYRSLPLTATE